jgi:membrane-associated phospholipid phosphatase
MDRRAPRVIDQQPNIVWRADAAGQRTVRDSTLQASPALRDVAKAANWWGGPGVIWFAAALWFGGRAFKRSAIARVGLRGAEGLAVASALSAIIKGFAGRGRPFVFPGEPWHWDINHGWSDAHFFSMPSGHTTATTAFAMAVLVATHGWSAKAQAALALPLLVSAGVVAFARMYSDQHWLSDVVVALVLGAATSVVLARWHARNPKSRYDRVMLGPAASP